MKKGMTLIEVLVSALILTIGVTSLMFSFVYSNNVVENNTHKMNATSAINVWFEGIQRRDKLTAIRTFLSTSEIGTAGFAPRQILLDTGEGSTWSYWLEFNLSQVVTPDPDTDLNVVVARASWDKVYKEGDSEDSIYMVMYTNEPTD